MSKDLGGEWNSAPKQADFGAACRAAVVGAQRVITSATALGLRLAKRRHTPEEANEQVHEMIDDKYKS